MLETKQAHTGRIVGGITVVVMLAGAFHLWNYRVRARGADDSHDFGSQMISYAKQGRYDAAVQVGLHELRNDSRDEFVYQQIAMVYLQRANKDSDHRQDWVNQGVSYIEKSLSLNSKEKDIAGASLLQDALTFKEFGNLSADHRCAYYARARKLLEDRVSMLQGDKLTLEGRDFPFAPLRNENEKFLSDVNGKAAAAGCN
jgi:hypothetical protein